MWHSPVEKPDDDRYVLVELTPDLVIGGYSRYMVCNTENGSLTNKEGGFTLAANGVERWAYVLELS